jgi:predicted alpha/beta hydrolase family esterase
MNSGTCFFAEEVAMPATVLILPGLGDSGPQHWQSLWEQSQPDFVRVQQRDWDNPICEEWVAAIEEAVKRAGPDVVLVAHSLACLAVAHWAAKPHAPIKAALLVAVPDCRGPEFPDEAVGFSDTPNQPFPFRTTVVVSADDPYASPEHSEQLAAAWGSRVVHIGSCGHINANSGLGAWAEGYELLNQLRG